MINGSAGALSLWLVLLVEGHLQFFLLSDLLRLLACDQVRLDLLNIKPRNIICSFIVVVLPDGCSINDEFSHQYVLLLEDFFLILDFQLLQSNEERASVHEFFRAVASQVNPDL